MCQTRIRTARAKEIAEFKVIDKHAMGATLTPLITPFGADIAFLLVAPLSSSRSSMPAGARAGEQEPWAKPNESPRLSHNLQEDALS
nr:hypothetical protein [uncultured Cohaesibacter sp.]